MKTLLLLLALSTFTFSQAQFSPEEKTQAKIPVITNDIGLPDLLDEFYKAARYYRVDYKAQILLLKEVKYVPGDLNFLGSLSEDGSTIYLNIELLKYPNLARVELFRQFGKIYGLKDEKTYHHYIMGTHWSIDPRHEAIAHHLRTVSHKQKRVFFEKLAKKHPIEKKL